MHRRFVPVALTIALACYPSAFAQSLSDRQPKTDATVETTSVDHQQLVQTRQKLKQDVSKMVSDARSGSFSIPKPQVQVTKNNLSTGQKIAIVAVIAAAVVVSLIVVKNKLDDCC